MSGVARHAGDAQPVVVYVLWHFKLTAGEDFVLDGNDKYIGVYSSQASAEAAVTQLLMQPGFCDWPEGFRIFPRELDRAFGAEGFAGGYTAADWARSLYG